MSDRIESFLTGTGYRDLIEPVARYLRVQCGAIRSIEKEAPTDVSHTPIHAALTYMDNFVQDYIALALVDMEPSIRLILEETSAVRHLGSPDPYCGSVLIDPIDGTAEFVAGGEDFSILVCLLRDGEPKASVGYYPFGSRTLISGDLDERLPKTGVLACHYRIDKDQDGKWGRHLRQQGNETLMNGRGFATNLSAAQMVIDGRADALVFPFTAAHDAIAPAHIVKQHGGVARRYELGADWSAKTRQPFAFADVENDHLREAGSPRVRVMAARTADRLDELEHVLSEA